jgi:hypothetical protein
MGSQGDRSQEAEGRVMHNGTSDTGDGFFPAIGDDLGDGLSEDLRARVKAELEPGERLLWAGRSAPPPVSMGIGYFVAFGTALLLLAAAVVIVFEWRPRAGVDPGDPIAAGILLGLIGFFMAGGTIWARIYAGIQRARQVMTFYAVTDRRAIAWIPEPRNAIRVHSLTRGRIHDVSRVEKPDGSGTLEFTFPTRDMAYTWKEEYKHIPEVRRVEQIVRNNLILAESVS